MWSRGLCRAALIGSAIPSFLGAQATQATPPAAEPIVVRWNVPDGRFIDRRTALDFTLSRSLAPDEGRIAVMIGSTDVTDMLEQAGTTITYRPRLAPLPSGEHEVVVYRLTGDDWTELQRFQLRVLTAQGLVSALVQPTTSLGSNGQVAEGRSSGIPEPERPTFQDLTLTSGLRTSHKGARWAFETQTNLSGFSRREQSLRFAQRGPDAPRVDLSDYAFTLTGPRTRLTLGHVSLGDHRHVASSFGSRGLTLANTLGATTLTLGAVNGTSVVGWDNFSGLDRPQHRIWSATVSQELIPARPGGLRASFSMLDGSLLPEASFTQGAVVDAEESRGFGVQLSGTMAQERIRVAAGYARSRFDNPATDGDLLGDTVIIPVRAETRNARFAEFGLGLIQNKTLKHLGTLALSTNYRHERVDPLFRTAAASVQADQQQHAVDVSGSLGIVSMQVAHSRLRDNLDDVPSVLRTSTRQSTLTGAVALPALTRMGRVATWLPVVSLNIARGHQFAKSAPTNGDFRPQDLPDQVSLQRETAVQWQLPRMQLSYRFNTTKQDNRQAERQSADFTTRVHAVAAMVPVGASGSVGLDLSSERQHAAESNTTSRVNRLGGTGNWKVFASTSLTGSVSTTLSRDASRADGSRNVEGRLELSQSLLRIGGGEPRAQLFLRYASTAARTPALDAFTPLETRRQWTLSSGLNARLF